MPTLSLFYGIIITMYPEIGGKHHLPHFHAKYQDHEIVMTFDGEILEGTMPSSKIKLISAWAEIHKEDLQANWDLLSSGNQIFRIEPLR